MATKSSSSGSTTRNTWLSCRLMVRAMTRAVISITGARTSIRMPIIRVICTDETSFVSRVIRDAVENRSMLAKENLCTWAYSAARTLAPKPMPALAARAAAPTPITRDARAIRIIFRPVARMYALSPLAMPTSTIWLMALGSSSSSTASPAEHSTPRNIQTRYPLV